MADVFSFEFDANAIITRLKRDLRVPDSLMKEIGIEVAADTRRRVQLNSKDAEGNALSPNDKSYTVYSDSYAKFRARKGRQIDRVDVTFRGQSGMWGAFRLQSFSGGRQTGTVEVGFGAFGAQAFFLEKRYGFSGFSEEVQASMEQKVLAWLDRVSD